MVSPSGRNNRTHEHHQMPSTPTKPGVFSLSYRRTTHPSSFFLFRVRKQAETSRNKQKQAETSRNKQTNKKTKKKAKHPPPPPPKKKTKKNNNNNNNNDNNTNIDTHRSPHTHTQHRKHTFYWIQPRTPLNRIFRILLIH